MIFWCPKLRLLVFGDFCHCKSYCKLNMRCLQPISFKKLWNFGKTFSWYRHVICHHEWPTNPQFGISCPGYHTGCLLALLVSIQNPGSSKQGESQTWEGNAMKLFFFLPDLEKTESTKSDDCFFHSISTHVWDFFFFSELKLLEYSRTNFLPFAGARVLDTH